MRKFVAIFFAAFVALLLTAQQTPEQFNFYVNTLPAATTAFSGDQLYVRQAGLSKQMTIGVLTAGLTTFSGALTVGDCASWSTTTGRLQDSGGPCQATPGGFNGQVQVNLSGAFGGINNTSLTALINPCTASLSGAVPAGGGNTNLFLNGNCAFSTPAGAGNVSTSGSIVIGNCAQWNGTTTLISTGAPCGSGGGGGGGGTNFGYINVQTFGTTGVAMGDGTCHPLSASYPNLAAAQAVFPFVSDLTQCNDWAAIQQAINVSYATAPVNAGLTTYCPSGQYALSNPLFIDSANNSQGNYPVWASGTIYGNGANVTYNGIPWISMGSGNVGNPPTSQNLFPAQIQLAQNSTSLNQFNYPWAVVSISNASPAVFTILGGGSSVVANQPIVFFPQQFANPNAGAAPVLPTGINANQVYYAVGSSITGSTFTVSTTPGGAAVNTSSAGVGTFFASGQVWQVAPVGTGSTFSNRIAFVGAEGIVSQGGCRLRTPNVSWTTPVVFVSGQNGILVKNVFVQSAGPAEDGSATYTGARCTAPFSLVGQPTASSPAGPSVGSAGFALISNGGGSRSKFENTGAAGFYFGYYIGYGTNGSLSDQNTWDKPYFVDNCVGVYMGETQAFINSIYEASSNDNTTGLVAHLQQGVKVSGGTFSSGINNATSFAVTGVSSVSGCGFLCVTATITTPNVYLQQPMCAYSAGAAFNAGVKWLNSWFMNGCGYNTWVMNVPHWGLIGMYVMNYVPQTGVITLGVPASYSGIYQGTCCGSDLTTQLATVTTLYATEAVTSFFGNNQVDNVHIENAGAATTISAFATKFFGGAKLVRLTDLYLNTEASLGSLACCNLLTASAKNTANFYAQNTIPFFNCTIGDCVIDGFSGGFNGGSFPTSFNGGVMDRVLIATETSTYVEGRHMIGSNNQNVSSGSGGNNAAALFDFANSSIGNSFLNTAPLVNPGTLGQASGGYYAMGGSAYGSGTWDNPSNFVSSAAYSVNASNQLVNQADTWRSRGWGQSRYWGVRPEQASSPCILPSQATSLASLPAITHVSALQDFLHVSSGGTGYTNGDTLTLVGGAGTAATVTATVSSGVITSVHIITPGSYTTESATFTATGGTGTGATFNLPIWYVHYTIGYPLLWGGHVYHACNWNNADFGSHVTPVGTSANTLALKSTHTGWTYGQNLTTTNVPNLAWSMDGASPFVYMNQEALELMFPGLVISLTPTAGGGTCTSNTYVGIVLETHVTGGYVKTVGISADGSAYVPALTASGTVCTGTTIAQQAFNLVYPY